MRPAQAHPLTKHMNRQLLSARSLTMNYEDCHALVEVDFDLEGGESVAIMGPSGSGKTTLLHCLAGIIVPQAGSVTLHEPQGGVDLAKLADRQRSEIRRKRFGFVFQQGLLIPELTAAENVALPLMLDGIGRGAAERRAGDTLTSLGLVGLESRRIGQLSGGQAQRVAIARAQVADPSIVFADEPTGALDSKTSADVMTRLLSSTSEAGRALVVVTHDRSVAGRCSRIVHITDGRVEKTVSR